MCVKIKIKLYRETKPLKERTGKREETEPKGEYVSFPENVLKQYSIIR